MARLTAGSIAPKMSLKVVLGLALWALVACTRADDDTETYSLPDGFLFGVGTSSYQTEGAWNVSGKGENVFDYQYHLYGTVNGDVAADSYHHVTDDVELLKKLKVNIYRFSISWSRLLPNGTSDQPNADGLRFYNELLDALIEAGITPMVTLYHFDHPQVLEDKYGSWLNSTMADVFADYATYAFEQFGSRVPYWTTFNEPNLYCSLVYQGGMPPGLNKNFDDNAYYTCVHHILLAHAKAYRIYEQNFTSEYEGKVGITINAVMARGYDNTSDADVEAASRWNTFEVGLMAHALTTGDYPAIVKKYVALKSYEMGLSESRLPKLTASEQALLKGAVDFFGLNVYYGVYVTNGSSSNSGAGGAGVGDFSYDADVTRVQGSSIASWSTDYQPWVMRDALLYVRDNYDNISSFISENGFQDYTGTLNDTSTRAGYLSAYMRQLVKAANEDNVNVFGMTAWSFLDDYEWSRGYDSKMGLVYVDYSSSNRTRTLKESASFIIQMMTEWKVPYVEYVVDDSTTENNVPTRGTAVPPGPGGNTSRTPGGVTSRSPPGGMTTATPGGAATTPSPRISTAATRGISTRQTSRTPPSATTRSPPHHFN